MSLEGSLQLQMKDLKINILSFHFMKLEKEMQMNPRVGIKMGHKPNHKSYDHKASKRKHRRISS